MEELRKPNSPALENAIAPPRPVAMNSGLLGRPPEFDLTADTRRLSAFDREQLVISRDAQMQADLEQAFENDYNALRSALSQSRKNRRVGNSAHEPTAVVAPLASVAAASPLSIPPPAVHPLSISLSGPDLAKEGKASLDSILSPRYGGTRNRHVDRIVPDVPSPALGLQRPEATLVKVMRNSIGDESNEEVQDLVASRRDGSSTDRSNVLARRAVSLQRRLPGIELNTDVKRSNTVPGLPSRPIFITVRELSKAASAPTSLQRSLVNNDTSPRAEASSPDTSPEMEPRGENIPETVTKDHTGFRKRSITKAVRLKNERLHEEQKIDEAIKADWDISIWHDYDRVWTEDDPNPNIVFKVDPETGESVVEAASLNELVKFLTTSSLNLVFIKAFIVTYKSFTTPEVLLTKLIQRYDASYDIGMAIGLDVWKTIKVKCLNLIHLWLSTAPLDWTMPMLVRAEKFLQEVENVMPTVAQKLLNKLRSVRLEEEQGPPSTCFVKPPPAILKHKSLPLQPSPHQILFSLDPTEMARQITLVDRVIFSRIKSLELLDTAWSSPHLKYRAKNVLEMIEKFNERSYWVQTLIVTTPNWKRRVKVFALFVLLAKELRELNNFSGMFSILAGLGCASVYRLKWTRESISEKLKATYAQLQALTDTTKSYKIYRDTLREVVPPAIPHLGVFLTDLTFVSDGNPDILYGNLINFKKRMLEYTIVYQILQFQQDNYNLRACPPVQQLLENSKSVILSDDEIFQLSRKIEPKGWTGPTDGLSRKKAKTIQEK